MLEKDKLMSMIENLQDKRQAITLLAMEEELTITEMIHILKECGYSIDEIAIEFK